MRRRGWFVAAASFLAGASGAAFVLRPRAMPAETLPHRVEARPNRDDALTRANANLVSALQDCDRRLTALGEPPVHAQSPAPPVDSAPPSPRPFRDRSASRHALTDKDWERMAGEGAVRVQIPCIRARPWRPPQSVIARAGLRSDDVDLLVRAYERSNRRVSERVRRLCAGVLASDIAAEKVGPKNCIDVIQDDARRHDPTATREALSRVAEIRAGKRPPPRVDSLAPIEQLALALTEEDQRFEDELAESLGRDDARRLASAPELCIDRFVLRSGVPETR